MTGAPPKELWMRLVTNLLAQLLEDAGRVVDVDDLIRCYNLMKEMSDDT